MSNASNPIPPHEKAPGKTWYGHPVSEVLAAIEAHQGPRPKPRAQASIRPYTSEIQTTTSHRGLFIFFTCALLFLGASRRVIEARVETDLSDFLRPRLVAAPKGDPAGASAPSVEAQRRGTRANLGLGVSLISVLARLRELASDDQVTLTSITVPRTPNPSTGLPPELRESLVRLTVTGPLPALLTYTEDVAADKLPLTVQSAELSQPDRSSPTGALQLGLTVLETTTP
jgi:hypothetical protein